MIGRGRDLSAPRETMELTVKAHEPVRLDLYLREALVWKSRKRIQTLIRSGNITVNGKDAKPSQGVRGGDRIQVTLSMGTGLPEDYDAMEVPIIYEDRWLVAVNKPPGLLVHPVGRHVYDTLMNYLHYRYLHPPGGIGETAGAEEAEGTESGRDPIPTWKRRYERRIQEVLALRLCHRIDKDTTGIILVAKESHVHQMVQAQFEERKVSKEYFAIAHGRISPHIGDVDIPIGEGENLKEALAPPLKPAVTRLRPLEHFPGPGEGFTLVAARPVTGRQNQIRVHLAAIGHPIVGDTRYGGGLVEGFPARYILHARWIRFFHPRLKTWVELEAAPPGDFKEIIRKLTADRDQLLRTFTARAT